MAYITPEYSELLNLVADYYGAGSQQWFELADGLTNENAYLLYNVPGVDVTRAISGDVIGFNLNKTFEEATQISSGVNSNIGSATYGSGAFSTQISGTLVKDATTEKVAMESGSKLASTGATIATVADRASLAVAGVALGTKLGKAVDETLYNLNPDWWDEHYPSINPDTWTSLASSEGGKNVIRTIFGIDGDNMTAYMDERMLAQTYMTLQQNGAYNKSSGNTSEYSSNIQSLLKVKGWSNPQITSNIYRMQAKYKLDINDGYTFVVGNGTKTIYTLAVAKEGTTLGTFGSSYIYIAISEEPFYGGDSWGNLSTAEPTLSEAASKRTTRFSGKQFYYWVHGMSSEGNYPTYLPQMYYSNSPYQSDIAIDLATIVFDGVTTTISPISGINDDPTAQTQIDPSLITGTTVDEVLQQLKQNYPELFDGSIYEDVPQPDGTIKRFTYVPVPYPNTTSITQPTTGDNHQTNPQLNPQTNTQQQLKDIVSQLTGNPTPPDTGTGETPEPIVPVGEHASSLWAIYNPTLSQLNSFGAWLWDSNFVEQIKKMFNDPMQSIIGLHKVYATPSTGGSQNIKVGYLDSGVPSAVVTNQYTTVHCGSVRCPEYFGNVFDYAPYTEVKIFLPFIGIVPLDVSEVMRSTISVTYQVDVLTGACLAEVSVRRDGGGGILYTYAGNCAAQYPLSSGSYISVACAVGAVAAGAAGSFLTGNPAPLVSSLPALASSRTNVQHSGGYTGNAGAMGGKKPYLIITRPQVAMADNYSRFIGNPANHTTRLGSASGFVRVSSVHVEGMNATDNELNMIKEALEEGVIV